MLIPFSAMQKLDLKKSGMNLVKEDINPLMVLKLKGLRKNGTKRLTGCTAGKKIHRDILS